MIRNLFFLLIVIFTPFFARTSKNLYNLDESAKIGQLVKIWNDAINNDQMEKLNSLYADRVVYYVNDFSKKQCIDSKALWLSKHKGYKQKIKDLQLTRSYRGSRTIVTADFHKEYTNNGKTSVAAAFLEFEKLGNNWQIVKESDAVSESKRLKETDPVTLPKGEYAFSGGLHVETEDEQGDLDYSLSLNIGDDITGSYNFWSYITRTTFSYTVIEAKMENGILELSLLFDGESGDPREHENESEDELETQLRFKIISGNELYELNDAIPVSLFLDEKADTK